MVRDVEVSREEVQYRMTIVQVCDCEAASEGKEDIEPGRELQRFVWIESTALWRVCGYRIHFSQYTSWQLGFSLSIGCIVTAFAAGPSWAYSRQLGFLFLWTSIVAFCDVILLRQTANHHFHVALRVA